MLLVLPAAVGGLLGLGLVAAGLNIGVASSTGGGLNLEPPRLKPIAISPQACPSLDAVRVASGAAEGFWNRDAITKLGTPAVDRRLDALLAPLDHAVRVAVPRAPARLRLELSGLAQQVEIGRALIAYKQAGSIPFFDSVMAGVKSLSNASDLVGRACGLPLYDDA
jgi:hypothetical protein